MPNRSQSDATGDKKRRTGLPEKCRRCAMLSAEQAQTLHGPQGDGCWNPNLCYSRRSYARHRDRINQGRRRKRQAEQLAEISLEFEPVDQCVFAVLVVYRPSGTDTPIHAIGAEIWQGQQPVAIVPAIHCVGMVPTQVHRYVEKMLTLLEAHYGIKKFASQRRLDPQLCPTRPCPLHG